MGDYKEETKVSDTPLLAKEGWEELKNIKPIECGHCKSMNTVCIYRYAVGSIICATINEEFLCRDCGKFTSYYLEYES